MPDPLRYVDGLSLYTAYFIPNHLDPSGKLIWACIRKTTLPFRIGNHKYLWDDTTKKSCGWPNPDPAFDLPPGTPSVFCVQVPGSARIEKKIMDRCAKNNKQWWRWLWVPYVNDCHSSANDACSDSGLDCPPLPRMGDIPTTPPSPGATPRTAYPPIAKTPKHLSLDVVDLYNEFSDRLPTGFTPFGTINSNDGRTTTSGLTYTRRFGLGELQITVGRTSTYGDTPRESLSGYGFGISITP